MAYLFKGEADVKKLDFQTKRVGCLSSYIIVQILYIYIILISLGSYNNENRIEISTSINYSAI